MKLSLLKHFAWISLLIMALVSCRSTKIFLSGEQAKVIHVSFTSGSFEKLTFKAKAIYQQRELTGRMLIKNTRDGNYKIAFYNELGMTYLEGTLKNSSKHKKLIVKNIAPIIDHKSFVNRFEKSLQTVFSDKPKPYTQSLNPPITQSANPPSPHAPTPPENDENILVVQLRNGFRLELRPQNN